MPDLNPACKTDPFPDWPFGVNPDDPREPWDPSNDIDVPVKVQACSACNAPLVAEVFEWNEDGDATGIHLHCTGVPDNPASDEYIAWKVEHWEWPAEVLMYVEQWIQRNYQMITDDSPRYA